VFTGFPEEQTVISFNQITVAASNTGANWKIGIGINSISFVGTNGAVSDIANQSGLSFQSIAQHVLQPSTGINTILSLENANSAVIFQLDGQQPSMLLQTQYRG
jgi:hypothetical protein